MTRYTADELREMANKLHYSGTDEFSEEASEMLNQAADDALYNIRLRDALRGMLTLVEGTGLTEFDEYAEAIDAARKENA